MTRPQGPRAVLRLERVALKRPAEDEIRVRSSASAVNHSDLQIRIGN